MFPFPRMSPAILLVSLLAIVSPGGAASQPDSSRSAPGIADDSLRAAEIELEMDDARDKLAAASFWRRLIPSARLTASFGLHDALLTVPGAAAALPRDAYRLTLEFSITGIFDGAAHGHEELRLRQLALRLDQERITAAGKRQEEARKRIRMAEEIGFLAREALLSEAKARFDSVRFAQGSIPFDVLVISRLEALRAEAALARMAPDARAPLGEGNGP